jgi:hypothetical protein
MSIIYSTQVLTAGSQHLNYKQGRILRSTDPEFTEMGGFCDAVKWQC